MNVRAMRQAVARLRPCPSYVLTDGFPVDGLEVPGLAMWKGDRVAACIAAASVLAKVERDAMMVALDPDHPVYGWAGNKGYAAPEHMDALSRLGACELHRRSWRLPGVHDRGLLGVLNEGTDRPAPPVVAEQTATTIR